MARQISFFNLLAAPRGMWNLITQPGIEPVLPALDPQSLNHWTPKELQDRVLKDWIHLIIKQTMNVNKGV